MVALNDMMLVPWLSPDLDKSSNNPWTALDQNISAQVFEATTWHCILLYLMQNPSSSCYINICLLQRSLFDEDELNWNRLKHLIALHTPATWEWEHKHAHAQRQRVDYTDTFKITVLTNWTIYKIGYISSQRKHFHCTY